MAAPRDRRSSGLSSSAGNSAHAGPQSQSNSSVRHIRGIPRPPPLSLAGARETRRAVIPCSPLCPDVGWPSSVLVALAEQAVDGWHTGFAFHLGIVFQLMAEPLQRTLGRLRVA